jgi:thiamine-phosphate pyrophosphorylase
MDETSEKLNRNWRLCVIVGGEEDPIKTAEAALQGGVRTIQYRGKEKPGAVQMKEAVELRALTRRHGAGLVVNDRADIALISDADGLHLGQKDLSVSDARRIMGAKKVIGATAHSLEEAQRAEEEGADYIGFGSVFNTRSKKMAAIVGIEALKEVVRKVDVPVIGIGGITVRNIQEVFQAGVRGVAVLSAVYGVQYPHSVTRQFIQQMGR